MMKVISLNTILLPIFWMASIFSCKRIACSCADGKHPATVNYSNPGTSFSNTYTLQVGVKDCKVNTIYFNNGGWLDESHITAGELSFDGSADIKGENGKTYHIQIEN